MFSFLLPPVLSSLLDLLSYSNQRAGSDIWLWNWSFNCISLKPFCLIIWSITDPWVFRKPNSEKWLLPRFLPTQLDIFRALVCALDRLVLQSTINDREKTGAVTKFKEKVFRTGTHCEFDCFLSDNNITHALPYHSEARWLILGAVPQWIQDIGFLVDITDQV